ncbi:cation:proton antiporter [Agrobacterium arsenijevicii]|uniref:Cation:proton antiporter n=1 Tax=Agrobacterium arsenijevicii TaxID=1585697 RepID=A0ABR5D889_9HYPH|nr:cation:proton antiporter [Agrobacterium arsenijevicii]
MTPEQIVSFATILATVVLSAAFLLTVYRVVVGPTLPDRIVALDMLVGIAIGFIAVIAIRTGFDLYVDIAIALGLVGFLATVAFARFVLSRGADGRRGTKAVLDGERASEDIEKPTKTGPKRGKRRGGR